MYSTVMDSETETLSISSSSNDLRSAALLGVAAVETGTDALYCGAAMRLRGTTNVGLSGGRPP
jgi:hypothetical protein